LFEPEKTFQF